MNRPLNPPIRRGRHSQKSLPLAKVYRLLEPGPVIMLTTARDEQANIMTMFWHTMIDFEPPLGGCIVSNQSHTFNILKATKECVINIPTVKIAKQVAGCGNVSGRKVVVAWIDPSQKKPKTLHHMGQDDYMVAGKTIKIATKVK